MGVNIVRHSLTLGLALAIWLPAPAACSGDSAVRRAARPPDGPAVAPIGATTGGDPAPRSRTPRAVGASTTALPVAVPPYSFDGSVPPPRIVDTGTDYLAIARSLLGYASWLKLHNPDSMLLPRVYVEGTDTTRRFSQDLDILAERSLRLVDVDQTIDVETVSIDADIVTFKVLEHTTAQRLVDPTGHVVSERPSGPLAAWIVVIAASPDGRWRIADISPAYTEPRVQL